MKILFVLITVLITAQPMARQLLFAAENNAPPYSDINGFGISFNIIDAVFENSEYDIKYVSIPYARALKMLALGEVDGAFNVTPNVENKHLFLFGKEALVIANSHFFYSTKSTNNYSTLREIPDGTPVGIMIGFEYGKSFDKHKHRFNLVKVVSQKQLINLLIHERIAMAIMYEKVAFHTLSTMSLPVESIRKGNHQNSSGAYLVFNKQKENSAEVAAFFDEKLRQLKQTKRYSELIFQKTDK